MHYSKFTADRKNELTQFNIPTFGAGQIYHTGWRAITLDQFIASARPEKNSYSDWVDIWRLIRRDLVKQIRSIKEKLHKSFRVESPYRSYLLKNRLMLTEMLDKLEAARYNMKIVRKNYMAKTGVQLPPFVETKNPKTNSVDEWQTVWNGIETRSVKKPSIKDSIENIKTISDVNFIENSI